MAQLKPCPDRYINEAKRRAYQDGMRYFVLFDSVLFAYRVVSLRTMRAAKPDMVRFDIVAVIEWE